MEENNALKIQVDTLAKEKLEIMERFKNVEDQVKITSRRLSRSADEVIDLNDTVSTSMFKETSTDSLPFHGFESLEVSNMEISSKQENKLKRNHSSPGTTQTKKNKRHPPIGSMIMIDAIDRKGVYRVKSKVSSSEGDFQYNLMKDNKVATFYLRTVDWVFVDGGEKIALKAT